MKKHLFLRLLTGFAYSNLFYKLKCMETSFPRNEGDPTMLEEYQASLYNKYENYYVHQLCSNEHSLIKIFIFLKGLTLTTQTNYLLLCPIPLFSTSSHIEVE